MDTVTSKIAEALALYRRHEIQCVALEPKSKKCFTEAWSTHQFTEADFTPQSNIGVKTGAISNGLMDIDLDWPEAVQIAHYYLPPTQFVFGRESKPASHFLYRSIDQTDTLKFQLPGGGVILELRGDGCQTMAPWSTHPSGEAVKFWVQESIAEYGHLTLKQACGLAAAACVIYRNMVEGGRHDLAIAVIGTLLRATWDVQQVQKFMTPILECGAKDQQAADTILREIERLNERLESDQGHVPGYSRLRQIMGEAAEYVRRWLNISTWELPAHLRADDPEDERARVVVTRAYETRQEGQELTEEERQLETAAISRLAHRRPLTELGNARRFVDQHGSDFLWIPQLGWHRWNGACWESDQLGYVVRSMKQVPVHMLSVIGDVPREQQMAFSRWAITSQSAAKINNSLELAKTEEQIILPAERLDGDAFLLGVANGTVSLRSGALQFARRGDFISKQAHVEYDPDAQCPRWRRFLVQIMGGRRSLVRYLQRVVGYMLTGDTREQVLFFFYGTGANGKSTLINVLRRLMGDYAQQTPADTFLVKDRSGGANPEIARLKGVRLAAAVETDDGGHLAEGLVKQLTGGDVIAARYLYRDYFEFVPQFKIVLAANHKPVIKGDDLAIWRRIHLVPFTVTIPEQRQDKGLTAKLMEELPGILNWAIEGCLRWQQQGLCPPDEVVEAVKAYRNEMDIIGQFLEECCITGPGKRVGATELYQRYVVWAEQNTGWSMKQTKFGRKLTDRGFRKEDTARRREYVGIGLLAGDF